MRDEQLDYHTPFEILAEKEDEQLIANALSQLSFRRRRAFILKVVHGKTLQKIGEELGVSRERARQIISKATRLMRCFIIHTEIV